MVHGGGRDGVINSIKRAEAGWVGLGMGGGTFKTKTTGQLGPAENQMAHCTIVFGSTSLGVYSEMTMAGSRLSRNLRRNHKRTNCVHDCVRGVVPSGSSEKREKVGGERLQKRPVRLESGEPTLRQHRCHRGFPADVVIS